MSPKKETPLFKAAELRNQKSQGEYRGILDQVGTRQILVSHYYC